MQRMRKDWMALLAVTAALLLAGASNAAPLPGTKAAGDDADRWLLPNAEVVLTVNVRQLLDAAAIKKSLPEIEKMVKSNPELKALLETSGIDPLKDVTSILASGAGTSPTDVKALLVLKGNFNAEKIGAVARKKPGEVKILKEGTGEIYEIKVQDQPAYAAVVNASTVVLTQSKEATLEAIKNGGKKVAPLSKEMKEALGRFTGKESIAVAMVVNDDLKKMMAMVPQLAATATKLQTLTASITVTDAVGINVMGHTTEAKAARQLMGVLTVLKGTAEVAVQGMEGIPDVVNDVLAAIKITTEKESVVISLNIDKAMLDKASKLKK